MGIGKISPEGKQLIIERGPWNVSSIFEHSILVSLGAYLRSAESNSKGQRPLLLDMLE
jgi:hypothetical protein